MGRWAVYYQSREYAASMGDPCLGVVEAGSRIEALAAARAAGLGVPDAPWVVPYDAGIKENVSTPDVPSPFVQL